MGLRSLGNPVASFLDVFSETVSGKSTTTTAATELNVFGGNVAGRIVGDWTYHTFTSNGTLTLQNTSVAKDAEFLLVAGGGAGGVANNNGSDGGGGALRICTVEAVALLFRELGEPDAATSAMVSAVIANNEAISNKPGAGPNPNPTGKRAKARAFREKQEMLARTCSTDAAGEAATES